MLCEARVRARYAEWIREHLEELGPEKDVIDLHYEAPHSVFKTARDFRGPT